jgi:hypothetical protein|tara:strand:- start:18 stop:539 length:522 start_codon:yes stop_codon:yes gene_type:complete
MFNKNFNLTVDEFLTPEECNSIIEKYNTMLTSGEDAHLNYEKCDIENDENLIAILNKRLPIVTDLYKQKYPEINYTGSFWQLTNLRFKKYNPGKSYDRWHSEHSLRNPHRILNIIVYLSDHNCGTKFYNGETIFSKTGRLTIFPSYFTHTHKGEVCPENKPRYILAGYYNFKQ